MMIFISGGYLVKLKSDEVSRLSEDLRNKDGALHKLRARLAALDEKVAKEEAALVTEQKQLVGEQMQEKSQASKLVQELAAAQNALAQELSHKKALQDQVQALNSPASASESPSGAALLSGHIQNNQTRLAEVERQLKNFDLSENDRKAVNLGEAKAYYAQVRTQEKNLHQQITDRRGHIKSVEKLISTKRKEKFNLNRDKEVLDFQHLIDADNTGILQVETMLQQLHQKETSDTQSNAYTEQHAAIYAGDTKSSLLEERTHLQGDLANLKSRSGLVKRNAADSARQVAVLHPQEHDVDVKIQNLNQTIQRLKIELAAIPHAPAH